MPRPDNLFTHLAGVPVHYDRFQEPEFTYGTRGKPLNFHCTEAFEQKLNACFQELWNLCPLGRAEVIASAGAFVNKSGAHGQGRAFDLDCLFWANKTFITRQYPLDRRFYLGVEAILRKHFGTVLNFEFNAAHQDHFHMDDLSAVGFSAQSRSRVLFLQMALGFLFDMPVAIDGKIGPETDGATRNLLVRLGLANEQEIANAGALHEKLQAVWLPLLDQAAQNGFVKAGAVVEKTPLQLLEDVYAVIEHELDGDPRRKTIETALTSFAQHDQTAAWLQQF